MFLAELNNIKDMIDHKLAHKYFPLVFKKYLQEKNKNRLVQKFASHANYRRNSRRGGHDDNVKDRATEKWSLATRVGKQDRDQGCAIARDLRVHHEVSVMERIVINQNNRRVVKHSRLFEGHGSCKRSKTREKGCCPIERERTNSSRLIDAGENLDPYEEYGYVPYHEVG
jgi:hypothetical protein